ncbi:hypothetical protein D3C80_1678130 [compost metagenome]
MIFRTRRSTRRTLKIAKGPIIMEIALRRKFWANITMIKPRREKRSRTKDVTIVSMTLRAAWAL